MGITGIRKIGEGCLIFGFYCHWCYYDAFCLQLWSKAGPHSLPGSEAPKGNNSYQWRHLSVFKRAEELLSLEGCGLLVLEKRNKGLRSWLVLLIPWEDVGICNRAWWKSLALGSYPMAVTLEVMIEQSKQPWEGLDFLQIIFISELNVGGPKLLGPK